ncbi:MAG: DUF58 domain-containing protein [Kineosporiaceae bacterium]
MTVAARPSAIAVRRRPAPAVAHRRDRRFSLRASWAGLTPRGGSFLAAGLVALLAAAVLRQTDLLRVAVLLVALPLAVVVGMSLVSLHVTVRRDARPRRVYAGDPVTVTVSLTNRGRQRTPTLLVEDAMPEELDVATRVVAPPLPARATARLSYTAVPRARGRYLLGPARVHAVEPFGVLERTWRASGTDQLLVRPRPVPLADPLRPARRGGDSDTARGGAAAAGSMDLTVREYREGDDLRRVHWPTTARRGELMVRRDERPEDQRLGVLLDARRRGHPGRTGSSLEWAVVAATSVVVRAALDEQAVMLAGDGVEPVDEGIDDVLDRLAVVQPGPDALLVEGAERLDAAGPTAVAAFLGDLAPGDVVAIADAAPRARRVALLLQVPEFARVSDPSWDDRHEGVRSTLAAAGWSTVRVRPGDGIAQAWAAAVQATER